MELTFVNLLAGGRGSALARMISPTRLAVRPPGADRALPFLDAN